MKMKKVNRLEFNSLNLFAESVTGHSINRHDGQIVNTSVWNVTETLKLLRSYTRIRYTRIIQKLPITTLFY